MSRRNALRAVAAALLVFASMLVAAPGSSSAASYTLNYTGTITDVVGLNGGVFKALGVVVGDAVSGTMTIDPFKTTPDATSSLVNTFDQASISYTFHVTHPKKVDLSFSDAGSGDVASAGTPNVVSGLKFESTGATSYFDLVYETDPNGPPLASLSGLPNTAAGLIARLGGGSPSARGNFALLGFGQVAFSVAVAATPIPATLPLLVSALGGLGFVGWRRRNGALSI